MKKWIMVVIVSLTVGGILGMIIWKYVPLKTKNEILSPLGLINKNKFEVVGFLPSWMIGKTKIYGGELTQLIFSGIEVNVDGSLVWDVQSKKINNDDYLNLKNNFKKTGGKNLVLIKLFTDKDLDALVASESAKQNLYAQVKDIVEIGKFDGVNVDFEYMSDPIRILNEDMMQMFGEMKGAGWGEINVDVFANTIIKGDAERLKKLSETVDGIIIMAYDFHRPGSSRAGAVAPMEAPEGQRSIEEIINRLSVDNLDKQKFIMALPLYGYQWETTSGEMNSATMANGYGVTVLYRDGIGYTGGNFDLQAKSPWYSWTEKKKTSNFKLQKIGKKYKKVYYSYFIDQWHQAYLENEESLKIKINAVKQAKLGGIGWWALGYEGKTDFIKLITN